MAKLSGQLFPESVWKDFGERVGEQEEEPWGPLGASWVPLWPSQGVPDLSNAVGSRLRGFSELSWGPLGALQGRLGGHLGRLGGLLGRLGALLGPSWGPLGPSWGHLGGLVGDLGAILGASWAVLSRRKAEKAKMPKSFKNLRKINDFGLFGPSWRTSWRPLGPSWRPLGPSWGLLGRLGALLGAS